MYQMSETTAQREWQTHLIDKFREMVRKRYDYDRLTAAYAVPNGIDRKLVNTVKDYFLMALYPSIETRLELEEAFTYLNEYVSHPSKTFKLIGSMSTAIFTFGFSLPRALKAGVLSLEAFLNAKKFEEKMKESVEQMGVKAPISDEAFMHCMAQIPENEARAFLKDISNLLTFITDTKLLHKTVEVMESVVTKMKKNPDTFSQAEISGIQLGIEIMNSGYGIFDDLNSSTKKKMIAFIMQVEEDFMDKVYAEKR